MSQDLFQQEQKATKRSENRYIKKKFLSPHVFWDPGCEKIRIRDKHPGSATLYIGVVNLANRPIVRWVNVPANSTAH